MTTFVYVVGPAEGTGAHKIGISVDVTGRLASLQTGHPARLAVAFAVPHRRAARVEALAHSALADWRLSGEWFDCPASMAMGAVVKAMAAADEECRLRELAAQPAPVVRMLPAPPVNRNLLAVALEVHRVIAERYEKDGDEVLSADLEGRFVNAMEAAGGSVFDGGLFINPSRYVPLEHEA